MYKIEHEAREWTAHGIHTCAGCGLEMLMRNTLSVLGEDTILIIPPGCAALFAGYGKETASKVAGYQCNLGNTASTAAGVRAGLAAQGNTHTTVVGFAGDGATVDIGLQALSGAMERKDQILYICYDNEAYMSTGMQGGGSTPLFAKTATTPAGKPTTRKDLVGIAIAHHIAYAATATISHLHDLRRKIQKARHVEGPSLLHVHTPCPPGWGYAPSKTVEVARAAVQTGCWILYEYENGGVTLNSRPKELKSVKAYIGMQGRFRGIGKEAVAQLNEATAKAYERTLKRLEQIDFR